MTLLNRITIDPVICHGKPCIRGMRWPVEVILDLLGSGMSIDDIINDHPELEREDISAALNYARIVLSGQLIYQRTESETPNHRASEQVLGKEWLDERENQAWQHL